MKINLASLDIDYYEETLENGLTIYVIPKKGKQIYATFVTKFGSIDLDFVPFGEKKAINVPEGIAHFLEHKMFEQPDGTDIMNFFSERGTDSNAATSKNKTYYLFSGVNFFEENLNCLLDYVQTPCFTDEGVEKEKGIIIEEIKMYEDSPETRLYDAILYNSFVLHPIRYAIGGTVKSVSSITKEQLKKCYDTFYHPSNMALIVTGNVNPNEVIQLVKKNQALKNYKKENKIVRKEVKEPDEVLNKETIIKLDVQVPKVAVNYKIPIRNIKGFNERLIEDYLGLFFDIKFSPTSHFIENLRQEGLITGGLGIIISNTNKHFLCSIMGESKDPDKLIKRIKKEMTDLSISESIFERKKKVMISDMLFASDSVVNLNHYLLYQYVKYGQIEDEVKMVRSLTKDKLDKLLKQISFEHNNVVMIVPKNKD